MSSVVISGNTSGSITLDAPTVAGSTTYTLAAVSGTIAPLVSGTVQNSTSGTSIDFTGIPSWAKRVTVMFNGVSTSGTSNMLVQLGSTTFQTTGYSASSSNISTGVSTNTYTTGFGIRSHDTASFTTGGTLVFTLVSGNIWVGSGVTAAMLANGPTGTTAGFVTLSGVLDRVRITTVNGTDTFDAGSINIMYE